MDSVGEQVPDQFTRNGNRVNETPELHRLAEIAQQLREEEIASDARALAERVAEGRFYIACVGQFKRGKSTLLDALVGESVLPTGVVPVTSMPTVLRFGVTKRARVLIDGTWQETSPDMLDQYVSEEFNPENVKRVAGVEVFLPSPLLTNGMCFVDTPGIGSVFAGNTAATRAFIPHIDAAIVVLGADPPVTGDELELVAAVGQTVAHLIFVLNKADRVTESERVAAIQFTKETIEARLGRAISPVLEISALESLQGNGNGRDWDRLGATLRNLSEKFGGALTQGARDRGMKRISEALKLAISERRNALLRPAAESERRIASMKETVAAAEQSLFDLGYLFGAEQGRLSRIFEKRRHEFLQQHAGIAHEELTAVISATPKSAGPAYRRAIMVAAQEVAHRHLLPWLKAEEHFAERTYVDAVARFVHIATEFMERLKSSGSSEWNHLQIGFDEANGLRARSEFSFYELIDIARPASPLRYVADLVLTLCGFRRVIEKAAYDFLDRLMLSNSSRVQHDMEQRVAESRVRLERDIRQLLKQVSGVAERALENAKAIQCAGANAIEAELERLTWFDNVLASDRAEQS